MAKHISQPWIPLHCGMIIRDHDGSWLLHVMQSPHSRVPQPAIYLSCFNTEEDLPTGGCAHTFPIPTPHSHFNLPINPFNPIQSTLNNHHLQYHYVSIRLPRSQPIPQTPSDRPVRKASAKPLVSTTTPGRPLRPMYRNHLTSPVLTRYIPVVVAIGLGSCTISHEKHINSPQFIRLIRAHTGFASYNYYNEAKSRHEFAMAEEEKRLARNQKLMDAYGSKDSLHDVQQALDTYHAR